MIENNTFELLSVPSENGALVKAGLASVVTLKRIKENISQVDMAMILGCSVEDVQRIEDIDYRDISVFEVFQILDKLDVDVSLNFGDLKVI